LATPNTTATRPSRVDDMPISWKFETNKDNREKAEVRSQNAEVVS